MVLKTRTMSIERKLNEVLKGIVDTYPDTADFEDEEDIVRPYAVTKTRRFGSKTKDGTSAGTYAVGVFLVTDEHDEAKRLEEEIRAAITGMEDRTTNVSFMDSTTEYDEDEAWVTEMNFEIKLY